MVGTGKLHGLSYTPEYQSWCCIKQRCYNPNAPNYPRYGGRGVTMCREWLDDPARFVSDMGKRPRKSMSIERLDNDGDYSPDNCVWADRRQQARNKCSNKWLEVGGVWGVISDWSLVSGVHKSTIRARLVRGWTPISAVSLGRYKRASRQTGEQCQQAHSAV